jgi:hypothetical protein
MNLRLEVLAKEETNDLRWDELCTWMLTTVVLAVTAYFHYMGLLSLFAIFAAILAILFGRAITSGVRTFCGIVFGHTKLPAFL